MLWSFQNQGELGLEKGKGPNRASVKERKKGQMNKTAGSGGSGISGSSPGPRHSKHSAGFLHPSPGCEGPTCCPIKPSFRKKVLGGSDWTSCMQRSSSGPEGRKQGETSGSAAPLEIKQPHSTHTDCRLRASLLCGVNRWGRKQSTWLGSPALVNQCFQFPVTDVIS